MIDESFLGRSVTNLTERVAEYLPVLLGALVVLVAGWLLSLAARWAVGRFLRRAGLDRWVEGSDLARGLQGAGIDAPLSKLTARLVFWVLLISTAVVALGTLGLELSELPVRALVAYLPVVLGALLVLVVGTMLASFLGRTADAGLAGLGVEQHRVLGRLLRLTLLAITVIVTVDQLGFDVALLSSTFGNLLILLAAGFVLTFAWGGREVAHAVLAGHYAREQYQAGDQLEVAGRAGTLRRVGPLTSELDTEGGRLVVPNPLLMETPVILRREAGEGPTPER